MDCKTDLSGRIDYTWSKTSSNSNHQPIPLASGQQLTISDATAEDAGRYICYATSSQSGTSVDITTVLVVTGSSTNYIK